MGLHGATGMTVEITTRGLDALQALFEKLPEVAEQASVLAVNEGARFGHARASRIIRGQVNFKAGYLGAANNRNGRLAIIKRAKGGDVEAVIRGRERPTSLARFVQGSRAPGRKAPTVKVAAGGRSIKLKGAWLMKLRAGKVLDDDTFNVGLAIRIKPGMKLNKREFANTYGDYRVGERDNADSRGGVYMLYGPSVAQVFRSVARDIQEPVSARVEAEFVRQFERLAK